MTPVIRAHPVAYQASYSSANDCQQQVSVGTEFVVNKVTLL